MANETRFATAAPIPLRVDYDAKALRRLAKRHSIWRQQHALHHAAKLMTKKRRFCWVNRDRDGERAAILLGLRGSTRSENQYGPKIKTATPTEKSDHGT